MLVHSSEEIHPAVHVLLRSWDLNPETVPLDVDARDEMYQFSRKLRLDSREMGLVEYFRAGWTAFETLQNLVDGVFGQSRSLRILDFASGYGRMTRFFVQRYGAAGVTVCEIDPRAVEFQRQSFGVEGVVSTQDPQALDCDGPFDCIFVASLFSHLPGSTFEAWLGRLWGLLAPDGVLAFTVHDEAVLLPGRSMPADGLYFEPMSESEFLDLESYGSTWVTEEYVAGAIERITGGRGSYHRIPRGLWHLQDIYLLSSRPVEDLEAVPVDRGLEGYVDRVELRTDGRLRFGGWAVDHAGDAPELEVEVYVNGDLRERLRPNEDREDVVTLHGERHRRSGWERLLDPEGPSWDSRDLLLVKAVAGGPSSEETSREYIVHCGTLETTLLCQKLADEQGKNAELESALGHLQRVIEDERGKIRGLNEELTRRGRRIEDLGYETHLLKARIAAMEASRFWKLRNRWFQLKAALGLGD